MVHLRSSFSCMAFLTLVSLGASVRVDQVDVLDAMDELETMNESDIASDANETLDELVTTHALA